LLLFVLDEGTLGIVVEATLKLQNIPQYRTVALCNYPTLKDAANTVIQMMQRGVRIGKVELLGNIIFLFSLSLFHSLIDSFSLIFSFSHSFILTFSHSHSLQVHGL
jgi:D-lactate dehydrogenase (cytochrome)